MKLVLIRPQTKSKSITPHLPFQIQKSGVLRKAIEHINKLQSTVDKLKYDNVQLKKKQDILEQNNRVLTMKLTEQGASVVYLEKTPGMMSYTYYTILSNTTINYLLSAIVRLASGYSSTPGIMISVC